MDDTELEKIINNELNKKLNFTSTKKIIEKFNKKIKNDKKNGEIKKSTVIYDYIIIGAGPTGLSLAWYLSQENKKILLIDKESSIGGCHRVQRVNGLFTEHGPRVYSDAYLNFIDLLKEMDINFCDLFVPYTFPIANVQNSENKSHQLSYWEIAIFLINYLNLVINKDYGKDISISTFMNNNNFSDSSKEYINRVCRLTDGATPDKYTVFQFMQLLNQQALYTLSQPNLPNDRGLLKLWEQKLKQTNNINILLNHDVLMIDKPQKNLIESIIVLNKTTNKKIKFNSKRFIITVPPKPMYNLLYKSPGVQNAFGDINELKTWTTQNSYFDYLPITMHWKQKLELPKIQGFPSTDWGVAFIVLSNYMKFEDKIELVNSQTVISTCVTFPERKSSVTNKTAHESTLKEIYPEVLRQLKISYPNLPDPAHMILSPQVYKDNKTNKWINVDTAYVLTDANKSLPPYSKLLKNLYNCGTHNGNSNYHFTSIESAVSNAKSLAINLEPTMKNKEIKKTYEISSILYMLLVIIVFYIILINIEKYVK